METAVPLIVPNNRTIAVSMAPSIRLQSASMMGLFPLASITSSNLHQEIKLL